MTVELSEVFSKLVPKQKKERLFPDAFIGHQKLFDFYGISCNSLNPNLTSGVTKLPTRDGDLFIDWDKRVIIAPLNYYSKCN